MLFPITSLTALPGNAVEVTPYIGKMFGQNLINSSGEELTVDNSNSAGISLAWEKGRHGQGQILINATSHRFATNTNNVTNKLNIIYAHFNGVAKFRQRDYTTTVSIGVGGSYLDVKNGNSDIYPSFTAAIGTRYEISKHVNFVTELRSYMTLTDNDTDIFCLDEDNCDVNFKSAIWTDTSVSFGLSYRF